MISVPVERLMEIAETDFDDVEEMAKAVRDVARSLAEVRELPSRKPPTKPAVNQQGRVPGKPLEQDQKTSICKKCGADLAVFISKRTHKPYVCDMILGDYGNQRTMLTGSNWLHNCPEGGRR